MGRGVTLHIPTKEATFDRVAIWLRLVRFFGGGDSTSSRSSSTMDEGDVKTNLNAYKTQISPDI